jgi:stalled ribosome alternative rescue factor ArfA
MKEKTRKEDSRAKSMVMVPLYAQRVVQDRTRFRRKPKHANSSHFED